MRYEDKGRHDLAIADYYGRSGSIPSYQRVLQPRRGAEKKGDFDTAMPIIPTAIKLQPGYAPPTTTAAMPIAPWVKEKSGCDYKRALAIIRTLQTAKDSLKALGAPRVFV